MKCQVMPSTYIFATSHGNPAREASSLAPPISTKLWKNLLWTSQVRGGAPVRAKLRDVTCRLLHAVVA